MSSTDPHLETPRDRPPVDHVAAVSGFPLVIVASRLAPDSFCNSPGAALN